MEGIIAGIITGICAIIGTAIQNSKSQAVIEYQIKDLETKVNKHNNLIDRMYKAETEIEVINEKLKNIN